MGHGGTSVGLASHHVGGNVTLAMKRLTLFGLAVAAVVAIAATNLNAQTQPTKIVFVDSQAAINSHPAGQKAQDLKKQAQTEIDDLRSKINELAQKQNSGQQLTAAENERYQTLVSTLNAVQQRYQSDINSAAKPAVDAVNQAIQEIAQENGYSIVMDRTAAAQGLVVYAASDLDITPMVIDRVKQDGASSGQ